MSHHLLSKKLWIVIIGMTCTFLGMAYVWLHYVNQWSMQAEVPVREEIESQRPDNKAKEKPIAETVNQAATDEIDKGKIEKIYPCIIQMIQGEVGIYTENGDYLQELNQAGELFSEIDRKNLQQGIWIQNEEELIMVLESYHLQ